MDAASPRTPSSTRSALGPNARYVVLRSSLLHNRIFSLGEVREMPDFGPHFERLHDCGHLRSVDPTHFGTES